MFGKHALSVQLVKTSPNSEDSTTQSVNLDPEQINRLLKDQVRHAALVVGLALAAKEVLDTASEIALIAAKARIR